jgi:hypothetical protein
VTRDKQLRLEALLAAEAATTKLLAKEVVDAHGRGYQPSPAAIEAAKLSRSAIARGVESALLSTPSPSAAARATGALRGPVGTVGSPSADGGVDDTLHGLGQTMLSEVSEDVQSSVLSSTSLSGTEIESVIDAVSGGGTEAIDSPVESVVDAVGDVAETPEDERSASHVSEVRSHAFTPSRFSFFLIPPQR